MDVTMWVHHWLNRHSVKLPPMHDAAAFTQEVMQRVRTVAQSREAASASAWRWNWWPQMGLALAAASVALVVLRPIASTDRIVKRILHDDALLSTLDDASAPAIETDSPEALAANLQMWDYLQLAQSPTSSDEAWIEQTLQVLDAVDESVSKNDSPESTPDSSTDDPWLEELDWLERQLSVSS